MTRQKSKRITVDNYKHHASPDFIETIACNDRDRARPIKGIEKEDAITFEIANCMAFLNQNEALQLIASLTKSGHKQWGDPFLDQVQTWIEAVR